MENETLKQQITKWIEQYRWAVDSQTIAPCSVSFAGSSITVLCPNEQTAKDIKELPAGGVVVSILFG